MGTDKATTGQRDGLLHGDDRAAAIAGMRSLLDHLETHPEIPLGEFAFHVSYYPNHHGIHEHPAAVAQIERIAAALGVEVTGNGSRGKPTAATTHFHAERRWGRHVEYSAVHINESHRKQRTGGGSDA